MKRLFTLLLAVVMLVAPTASFAASPLRTENAIDFLIEQLGGVLAGDETGLQVTLTDPHGKAASIGFGATTDGGVTAGYNQEDLTLLIDGMKAYLTDGGVSSAVSLEELLNAMTLALNGGKPIPSVTEEEFTFFASLGKDFINRMLATNSISWNLSNSVFNLHIDIDGILAHLNTIVPELLVKYRASFDPLLSKYGPYIFNRVVTVDQVLAKWPDLGLGSVKSGIVLDVFGFKTSNGISLIASCKNWNIQAAINTNGFSFIVTAPDGKTYPFDTADLLTAVGILRGVSASITEEAFKFEQTADESQPYSMTTHITVDFAMLERDLCAGLVQAINNNKLVINNLCSKYQPWFDLLLTRYTVNSDGELVASPAPQVTADKIARKLSTLRLFPHIKGELTAVNNRRNGGIVDMEGNLGSMLFEAHIVSMNRAPSFTGTIRVPGSSPLLLTLNGSTSRNGLPTITLASNQDMGGFRSITFSQTNVFRNTIATVTSITTDTDLIHLSVESGRYGRNLDLKLGNFEFDWTQNFSTLSSTPQLSVHMLCFNTFYLDLNVTNCGMDLDSTLGGFTFTEFMDGFRMEGYINEDTRRMTSSSFTCTYDSDNSLFTLSILPHSDASVHITYRTDYLSILSDDSMLVIADTCTGTPTKNITSITFDDEIVGYLVFDILGGEDIRIQLIEGATLDGNSCTLDFDFGAAGMAVPAGATVITAEEFMQKLQAAFNPDEATPAVDADESPDFSQLSDFSDFDDDEFTGY